MYPMIHININSILELVSIFRFDIFSLNFTEIVTYGVFFTSTIEFNKLDNQTILTIEIELIRNPLACGR